MHKQPCDGSNEKAHHSREQNLGPVDAAIQEVVPACIARLVLKSDSLLSADLCLAKHITPTARVSNISSYQAGGTSEERILQYGPADHGERGAHNLRDGQVCVCQCILGADIAQAKEDSSSHSESN